MLEDNVVNEATKRLKIEEKLQQALARSKKVLWALQEAI